MKYLFAILAFATIFVPSAHAEDIMSILERKSKVEKPSPPVLNPYNYTCLLYTSPSPRDRQKSRMPSSA